MGVTTLAIDICRFMPLGRFRALMGEHIRTIRRSAKARDTSRIYLPGEIEVERQRLSVDQGVDVDDSVCQSIDCLLEKVGLVKCLKDGELQL